MVNYIPLLFCPISSLFILIFPDCSSQPTDSSGQSQGAATLTSEKLGKKKTKADATLTPNPLDQTCIHPESYDLAVRWARGQLQSSACTQWVLYSTWTLAGPSGGRDMRPCLTWERFSEVPHCWAGHTSFYRSSWSCVKAMSPGSRGEV